MNRTFHSLLATAALLGGGAVGSAQAQDLYPRTVGSGENVSVEYGPGPRGNVAGGGRVVSYGNGEHTEFRHLDPARAQGARSGLVPLAVGSGENVTIVWVPADLDRTRLALIGPDGSLPAANTTGRSLFATLFGARRS